MCVVVSEESGRISVAQEGKLYRNISLPELEEKLKSILNSPVSETKNPKDLLKDLVVKKK